MEGLSHSEENYLKAIYNTTQGEVETVSTNELAEKMKTKASSITDMVKKLSDKKLVKYKKYKGCSLTTEGEKSALKVIRKHRLWEVFLVDKLGFGWDEVHVIAEQLEHIRSVKLTEKLDEFLEFPKYDPHGDPIPDRDGNLELRTKMVQLNELQISDVAVVIGVADGNPSFLQYLDQNKIQLGTELIVLDLFDFDESVRIRLGERELNLSKTAASKICVERLEH
ncbi:metal-dependent transcriptional regulator [Lishizhenia sp.]|uniref:metal-dependent transcriptional regulator n=1 Tax=Lishizhenia sp. TaxID=2497594 RepID=UPI00299D7C3E|nr:metal-dependent transcriptional regulator [Lishizhenia sp.]MDX1444964.1 metal-dependent transcriptional regulator [Lishizhenia sp.]